MSEPQFTPGPWRVRDEDGPPEHDVMVGDRLLATAYPEHYGERPFPPSAGTILRSYAEANANARLIAAAPELYAALLYVFEHIADKERGPRDLYPAFGLDARRAVEMARAALAKAEGRS